MGNSINLFNLAASLTGDTRQAFDRIAADRPGTTRAAWMGAIASVRAYLNTAPAYIADRWMPAYALLASAVEVAS